MQEIQQHSQNIQNHNDESITLEQKLSIIKRALIPNYINKCLNDHIDKIYLIYDACSKSAELNSALSASEVLKNAQNFHQILQERIAALQCYRNEIDTLTKQMHKHDDLKFLNKIAALQNLATKHIKSLTFHKQELNKNIKYLSTNRDISKFYRANLSLWLMNKADLLRYMFINHLEDISQELNDITDVGDKIIFLLEGLHAASVATNSIRQNEFAVYKKYLKMLQSNASQLNKTQLKQYGIKKPGTYGVILEKYIGALESKYIELIKLQSDKSHHGDKLIPHQISQQHQIIDNEIIMLPYEARSKILNDESQYVVDALHKCQTLEDKIELLNKDRQYAVSIYRNYMNIAITAEPHASEGKALILKYAENLGSDVFVQLISTTSNEEFFDHTLIAEKNFALSNALNSIYNTKWAAQRNQRMIGKKYQLALYMRDMGNELSILTDRFAQQSDESEIDDMLDDEASNIILSKAENTVALHNIVCNILNKIQSEIPAPSPHQKDNFILWSKIGDAITILNRDKVNYYIDTNATTLNAVIDFANQWSNTNFSSLDDEAIEQQNIALQQDPNVQALLAFVQKAPAKQNNNAQQIANDPEQAIIEEINAEKNNYLQSDDHPEEIYDILNTVIDNELKSLNSDDASYQDDAVQKLSFLQMIINFKIKNTIFSEIQFAHQNLQATNVEDIKKFILQRRVSFLDTQISEKFSPKDSIPQRLDAKEFFSANALYSQQIPQQNAPKQQEHHNSLADQSFSHSAYSSSNTEFQKMMNSQKMQSALRKLDESQNIDLLSPKSTNLQSILEEEPEIQQKQQENISQHTQQEQKHNFEMKSWNMNAFEQQNQDNNINTDSQVLENLNQYTQQKTQKTSLERSLSIIIKKYGNNFARTCSYMNYLRILLVASHVKFALYRGITRATKYFCDINATKIPSEHVKFNTSTFAKEARLIGKLYTLSNYSYHDEITSSRYKFHAIRYTLLLAYSLLLLNIKNSLSVAAMQSMSRSSIFLNRAPNRLCSVFCISSIILTLITFHPKKTPEYVIKSRYLDTLFCCGLPFAVGALKLNDDHIIAAALKVLPKSMQPKKVIDFLNNISPKPLNVLLPYFLMLSLAIKIERDAENDVYKTILSLQYPDNTTSASSEQISISSARSDVPDTLIAFYALKI